MINLMGSIAWDSIAGATYLAGGGFVGRLQLLGQLTGAVAGCVMERQRALYEIHHPVTNSLVSLLH